MPSASNAGLMTVISGRCVCSVSEIVYSRSVSNVGSYSAGLWMIRNEHVARLECFRVQHVLEVNAPLHASQMYSARITLAAYSRNMGPEHTAHGARLRKDRHLNRIRRS